MPVRAIRRWSRSQDRLVQMFNTVGYFRGLGSNDNGNCKYETPDHNDLDITGDIDIRVCARVLDITSTGNAFAYTFYSKGNPFFASTASYSLSKRSTGGALDQLRLDWRTAAAAARNEVSTGGLVTLTDRWYRVTLDVDDGASQHVVAFYYSDDPVETDPTQVAWTFHSDATTAGTSSIQAGTNVSRIGDVPATSPPSNFGGRIYYASVMNGIDGTIVADPDFRDRGMYTTSTTLTDSTGKVWTEGSTGSWVLPKQLELVDAVELAFPLSRREIAVVRR